MAIADQFLSSFTNNETKPVSKFLSSFSDFLRPNLFAVNIYPHKQFSQVNLEYLPMLCHEAVFPFHNYTTTTYWYDNRPRSYVNNKDYDPVNLVFYVDKDSIILPFFNDWNNQIIDPVTRQVGYYDDYISTIEIEIFDRQFQTVGIAYLFEAYPINQNPISLGFNQNDTIMTFSVSFQYSDIWYQFFDVPKQDSLITGLKRLFTINNLSDLKNFNIQNVVKNGIDLTKKITVQKDLLGIQNIKEYDIVNKASKVFKSDIGLKFNYGMPERSMIDRATKIFK